MSQLEIADNNVAPNTEKASPAYVPSLQRTDGQPPPIAAHGGLSYMSFDRAATPEPPWRSRMRSWRSPRVKASALGT
jgi:hypothetical protein